ncbi:isopenicillin N synthase family dioxygenase [Sedimentitalea nanhaiensis]|uniref:2-oxoglutarate-dependent ethylene/succinate-forming enzyme n=1 Tax=Sedimentitalea nanhaiensis TaxID=999627 RepID=A0A1I6YK17_9RHOB|nr:2-oxoglutarate and iron-dependent oxygenase domain-containing protein [Sedimentitalea nanhaiensis]SFT50843.1 Isopenicillin N synthase [Sedimentitalea nanhaiensis]
MNIPELDLEKLKTGDQSEMARLKLAVGEIGFLTVANTGLSAVRIARVLQAYRDFFHLPEAQKRPVDMARTGANRGWGGPGSEQVNPDANPDFKEVFDCGYELPSDHPMAARQLGVYAPNQWPDSAPGFRAEIETYYREALEVGRQVLTCIAASFDLGVDSFAAAFDPPMALLRGNYYPARPDWAGHKDFGIAAHTDYGCLTLLAMDGAPGLSVRMPDGTWRDVQAPPGKFVINFGEMLEIWTGGRVKATLHRVVGGGGERISAPLFLNPSYDTNVAPPGSDQVRLAGEHLTRRFGETYLHLKTAG